MRTTEFMGYIIAIVCGGVIAGIGFHDNKASIVILGLALIALTLVIAYSPIEGKSIMADSYYGYRQCDNHTVTTMHSVDVWRTKEGKQLRKVITTCGECGAINTRILTRNDVRKYIRDMA